MNHYITAKGHYTYSLPEGQGRMPRNARRTLLPAAPWNLVWPRWNGKAWEMVEDHRARTGAYAQQATPFWLPDDTADQPARAMDSVGPLPANAVLTPPERPADAEAEAELA